MTEKILSILILHDLRIPTCSVTQNCFQCAYVRLLQNVSMQTFAFVPSVNRLAEINALIAHISIWDQTSGMSTIVSYQNTEKDKIIDKSL